MENPRHEKELIVDLILTRNLIDCVAKPGWDVLDSCSVSLLRFPIRNALLITCYSDEFIPPELHSRIIEIAKFVHHHHGRTHICLRHHQKEMIMRWDSELLLRSHKASHFSPVDELL